MEKKEWTVGSFSSIFNPNKEILILKRADGKGWNLPGGRVDFKSDDGLISALFREVDEETKLNYSHHWDMPDLVGIYPSAKLKDIAVLFLLTYSEAQMGGAIPVLTDEAVEYRFVDRETLKKEIQLVSQQYLGHEFGRHWRMIQDAFDFVEKNYETAIAETPEICADCHSYDHDHEEGYTYLRRKSPS